MFHELVATNKYLYQELVVLKRKLSRGAELNSKETILVAPRGGDANIIFKDDLSGVIPSYEKKFNRTTKLK